MEQLTLFNASLENYLVDHFSADNLCDESERKKLEQKYAQFLKVTEKFNRQSVSYQLSKKDVLHSWLKYKEGFSAHLVNILLDEMGAAAGDWVMDPFIGSGTTALVCQMRGINSIGYDVMPISEVSIKAKSAVMRYNINEIRCLIDDVINLNVPANYHKSTPYITITRDAYPPENERFLAYIHDWNEQSLYSPEAKNLLTLCIINSLERCSYTTKSGQYLGWDCRSKKVQEANKVRASKGQKPLPEKHVRTEIFDSKTTILNELNHVLSDIELIQKNAIDTVQSKIDFTPKSALYELPLVEENRLKGVITSPPYCNRYDYTRTYALELVYLGLGENEIKKMRQGLLSCTVESKSKIEDLKEFYSSIGQSERFNNIYTQLKKIKFFGK